MTLLITRLDTFIHTTKPESVLDYPEMLGTFTLQSLPYSKNVKIWSMQRRYLIFSAVTYNSSSSLTQRKEYKKWGNLLVRGLFCM
jgi:hypothetical protein